MVPLVIRYIVFMNPASVMIDPATQMLLVRSAAMAWRVLPAGMMLVTVGEAMPAALLIDTTCTVQHIHLYGGICSSY